MGINMCIWTHSPLTSAPRLIIGAVYKELGEKMKVRTGVRREGCVEL